MISERRRHVHTEVGKSGSVAPVRTVTDEVINGEGTSGLRLRRVYISQVTFVSSATEMGTVSTIFSV